MPACHAQDARERGSVVQLRHHDEALRLGAPTPLRGGEDGVLRLPIFLFLRLVLPLGSAVPDFLGLTLGDLRGRVQAAVAARLAEAFLNLAPLGPCRLQAEQQRVAAAVAGHASSGGACADLAALRELVQAVVARRPRGDLVDLGRLVPGHVDLDSEHCPTHAAEPRVLLEVAEAAGGAGLRHREDRGAQSVAHRRWGGRRGGRKESLGRTGKF
eukprot:CAMPEP_0195060280 /NCGR_PEP_ID=MMETSP0448-20130528/7584_1 /TAXON_ID=66468 /ORGANISM="Heterocapsa triquestra, Strain CCMP 448" /LENGTH=213 /DNA_ID=CAMNT_0040090675 /DNA_START=45 /DNA_END=686 /DNA_ORIENTATION=-